MGPTTPQQGQGTDVDASEQLARQPVRFPRLTLPPVPPLAAPTTPSDELPQQHPLRDEPASTWQAPFPEPEPAQLGYTYQVMPPPLPVSPAPEAPVESAPLHGFPRPAFRSVALTEGAHPLMPAPARTTAPTTLAMAAPATTTPAPVPAPTAVPAMTTAATTADDPTTEAALPTAVSSMAVALIGVTAVFLVWASGMAFSAALLALAAMLVSELALALSLARTPGASRPMSATIAVAGSVVLTLLALRQAFTAFGDMAMVAGLFVIAATVPTLLLLGAAAFVIRRRQPRSLADESLRSGNALRFGVVAVILASGVLVRDSFAATPDAFVTFAIVALVAVNALRALRA